MEHAERLKGMDLQLPELLDHDLSCVSVGGNGLCSVTDGLKDFWLICIYIYNWLPPIMTTYSTYLFLKLYGAWQASLAIRTHMS